MGAVCGVDWQPLSLRELAALYHAVQKDRWDHTCFIASAMMAKPVHPWKLNPYRRGERKISTFTRADARAWYGVLKRKEEASRDPNG